MNRIDKLFKKKKKGIVSVYFTAGYPNLTSTTEIIKTLSDEGVDMIEIGIPFSDPLADGKIIQEASAQALKNGMNTNILFKQLEEIRKVTDIPLLIMGYYNSMLAFGVEKFLTTLKNIGVDGTILPDLPLEEYASMGNLYKENNIYNIFLLTPQTGKKRMEEIIQKAKGFLYVVSSFGTTGGKKLFGKEEEAYFSSLRTSKIPSPMLLGFGISNKHNFRLSKEYFSGCIIGSNFINLLKPDYCIKKTWKKTILKVS